MPPDAYNETGDFTKIFLKNPNTVLKKIWLQSNCL